MEKVRVPKYVANYIEKSKERDCELSAVFAYFNTPSIPDNIDRWLYDNTDAENDRRFLIAVKAWVEGYEVEEEEKYYWRKKREYRASFEDDKYLRITSESMSIVWYVTANQKYSESEARNWLGVTDFELFEKVED